MLSTINRLPRGLLDFLGIRSGGRYPQQLSEQLLPMMDLGSWYKSANVFQLQCVGETAVANTNAGLFTFITPTPAFATFTVPQDEVWIVLPGSWIGWSMTATAGIVYQASLVAFQAPSTIIIPWFPTRMRGFDTSSAAHTRAGMAILTDEVWLQPGYTLEGYRHGATVPAGSVTVTAGFGIVRLRT